MAPNIAITGKKKEKQVRHIIYTRVMKVIDLK